MKELTLVIASLSVLNLVNLFESVYHSNQEVDVQNCFRPQYLVFSFPLLTTRQLHDNSWERESGFKTIGRFSSHVSGLGFPSWRASRHVKELDLWDIKDCRQTCFVICLGLTDNAKKERSLVLHLKHLKSVQNWRFKPIDSNLGWEWCVFTHWLTCCCYSNEITSSI